MRAKLTDDQIRAELKTLGGWARENDALTKTFKFSRFSDGIAFVQRVATAVGGLVGWWVGGLVD